MNHAAAGDHIHLLRLCKGGRPAAAGGAALAAADGAHQHRLRFSHGVHRELHAEKRPGESSHRRAALEAARDEAGAGDDEGRHRRQAIGRDRRTGKGLVLWSKDREVGFRVGRGGGERGGRVEELLDAFCAAVEAEGVGDCEEDVRGEEDLDVGAGWGGVGWFLRAGLDRSAYGGM
jgi:hypothetical protein